MSYILTFNIWTHVFQCCPCANRLNELLVGSDDLNGVLFSFRADLKFRHEALCITRWSACVSSRVVLFSSCFISDWFHRYNAKLCCDRCLATRFTAGPLDHRNLLRLSHACESHYCEYNWIFKFLASHVCFTEWTVDLMNVCHAGMHHGCARKGCCLNLA
jgi:hypothetical protein